MRVVAGWAGTGRPGRGAGGEGMIRREVGKYAGRGCTSPPWMSGKRSSASMPAGEACAARRSKEPSLYHRQHRRTIAPAPQGGRSPPTHSKRATRGHPAAAAPADGGR